MNSEIAAARLRSHYLTRGLRGKPEDVVKTFGAVQAQEYPFARWALALRLAGDTTAADIDQAFDAGRILRTHVLRPTWHFVTPADIRWLLALTGPRVGRVVTSYTRREGISERTLIRALSQIERALRDGRSLTRTELAAHLRRSRIVLTAPQVSFVAMHAELQALVCSGPRRGKQFTYALLDERVPSTPPLTRDEALAELTRRYFDTHGPATVRDFVWWSGLTTTDARRALAILRAGRETWQGAEYWTVGRATSPVRRPDGVHLLPIYDEYLVAYRDRVAVPHGPGRIGSGPESVTFRHALVSAGHVAGTWNTRAEARAAAVQVTPGRTLSHRERRGLTAAVDRYARFLGMPVSLVVGDVRPRR